MCNAAVKRLLNLFIKKQYGQRRTGKDAVNMKPIKVLHLTPPFGLGGIHSYIFNHYKYLDQEKFRFTFMAQSLDLRKAEEFRDFSFDVKLLPTTAAKNPRLFAGRVREILMEGYDVLHLHNSYWTGFLIEEIAKEAGIPKVIVHAHSTSVEESDPVKRGALIKRHEEIKRAFSPDLATDFCACSRKAADWLFGPQIPRDKIRIMKNGIEVERFRYSPETRRRIRAELCLGDAFVFGTVGRLSYAKNPEFLIDLIFEVQKKHPKVKLMIVGDGELRKALEDQIRKSGLEDNVLLLGWKPDVENYLQAMDCFLLPSRFEGLGIAAIEAAASGLPCAVSDSVPEDIEVTPSIFRVPLEISAWREVAEKIMGLPIDRPKGAGLVMSAGYDIKGQAGILQAVYEVCGGR